MPFCLGILADAVASHRHELLPVQCTQRTSPLTLLQLTLQFIASSRSALMNLGAQLSIARPPSTGSDTYHPVISPTLTAKENDDINSITTSLTSSEPLAPRQKKATVSSKTSFQLAHPPPAIKHRQRFSIRPKVLLQLQQISGATRPIPVLDVLPSVVFAPKLARKFPSVYKGKDRLGADDLLVVTSQNYNSTPLPKGKLDDISEEDSWATREVVAAICQPKKREANSEIIIELCLNHGPVWEASPLPNGAYEFVSMDENGNRTVARWVPRRQLTRRRSHNGLGKPEMLPAEQQRKFTFSIINPNSRRHPVIATLYRSSIDISDQYSVPSDMNSPVGSVFEQTPASTDGPHAHFEESEVPTTTTMIETDEYMRNLIIISGIFVAFQEGYSPNFQYEKLSISPSPMAQTKPSSHKGRAVSLNLSSVGSARSPTTEKSLRQSVRSTSVKPSAALSHTPSPTAAWSPVSPVSPISPVSPVSPRVYSTGAAFLERAKTRRSDLGGDSSQTSSKVFSNGSSLGPDAPKRQRARATKMEGAPLSRDLQEQASPEMAKIEALGFSGSSHSGAPSSAGDSPAGSAKKPRSKIKRLFGCFRRPRMPA